MSRVNVLFSLPQSRNVSLSVKGKGRLGMTECLGSLHLHAPIEYIAALS